MNCPVCNSDNIRTTFKISRENFEIEVTECKNCGHFSQPDRNYQEIYTTGEFTQKARQSRRTPNHSKIKDLDKIALKRINYYQEYITQMDEFLEIGSSIGSFVHVLKLSGKTAFGLEPDPDYAHYSKTQYGFEQHNGLLEDFNAGRKYRAICSFHVLEHVRDPHAFLKKCCNLLKLDGKLLFEFPSLELHMYGSMKQTIWKPHFHYFTRASLYYLFSQYFKIVSVGYYGSALYVYAEKSNASTFQNSVFLKQKRKAKFVFTLVQLFPKIPVKTSGISAKQLVMQSAFFHNNRCKLINRFINLGIFAIRNKIYLNSETGSGGKTATHFSYYSGWENAGDTVLSKAVRDNFNIINPTSWTLEKVTSTITEKTIVLINKKDYMVIGGGGLLLPDSNANTISGWQWAISEELLDKIEVPIIVYAIGYNFFIGQKPEELFIRSLKKVIEKSSFFSLRNSGSIRAVKELVGDELCSKILYQPCPTTIIRNVDKSAPVKRKTKNVGVNIAFDRYHLRYGADIYEILNQVAFALKQICSRGYTINNLCHLENDKKFELTLDAHGVDYKSINLQYSLPKQTYETYCNMELVMGTRGHSQMIPFGLNTKIISLGSHNKLKWFLEDIDSLDWLVNLREDIPTLSERITNLFFKIIDSNHVKNKIYHEQRKLYDISKANYNIINGIIQ